MTTNLLDLFSGSLADDLAGLAGQQLGESPASLRSAADLLLPAIVGQLAKGASTADGAANIMRLLDGRTVADGRAPDAGATRLEADGSAVAVATAAPEASSASELFGDRLHAVTDSVASVAGVRPASASRLLDLAVPMVVDALKRYASDQHLDASGLKAMLQSQTAHMRGSLDPRVAMAARLVMPAFDPYYHPPILPVAAAPAPRRRGVLPWATLAAVAVLLIGLWRSWHRESVPTIVSALPAQAEPTLVTAAGDVTPTVGTLPTTVYFDVGDATLGFASDQILTTVATAIKRDGSRVAVTGYADRSGDAAKNMELAKHRAQAVRDGLVAAGVGRDRIDLRPPATITGTGSQAEARRVEITRAP